MNGLPRTLFVYLFRSLLFSWLIVASVLLLVLAVQQVAALLERVVNNQIAPDLLWRALGWATLSNVTTILPISLLLGIVLTLGRLASDSELTAIRACGLSPASLLVPIGLLAVPLAVLQGAVGLYFGPDAYCSALKARSQVARTLALAPVRPGVFQAFGTGSVYFVESVTADGVLRNVFIQRSDEDDEVEIILATRGQLEPVLAENLLRLRLFDGRRYAGKPGSARFRTLEFSEYQAQVPLPSEAGRCERVEARSSTELLDSNDGEERAELDRRLGLPVILLLLALLSVPLSAVRPRQGRFVRMPAALAVFFVYLSATLGLSSWAARNPALGSIAYWSLHAVVLIAALAWLGAHQGWWHRRRVANADVRPA